MVRRFVCCALWAVLAACGSSDDTPPGADPADDGCMKLGCSPGQFCLTETDSCHDQVEDGALCEFHSWCKNSSLCIEGHCVSSSATAGAGGAGAGAGGAAGAGGSAAAPIALELPFTPSNVGELVQDRMLSGDSDIVIRDGECRPCACDELMAVGTAGSGCYYQNSMVRSLDIQTAELAGAGSPDPMWVPIVVFVRNLIAGTDAKFAFNVLDRPLIIVAQEKIELTGNSLWLSGRGYPGGVPDTHYGALGAGPGGGGFERGGYPAGEGGAYCTFGGVGDEMQPPFGETYGNPELVPLRIGSGGGAPWVVSGTTSGGWGGGALQFVAGESIVIGPEREISVEGGPGGNEDLNGPGGGSGGSLLLEAPSITLDGSLLARGGPGGGTETEGGKGGDGRIRINTEPGGFTMGAAAVIDPALGTECATMGSLAP